jgi:outer membrane receptor protein involved in Fe transport
VVVRWPPRLLRRGRAGHLVAARRSSSPNQHYDPVFVLDLSVGYRITKGLEWTVGGSNIFDEMPTEQDPNETENGGRWENVQMGFNGAAIYTKLVYHLSTR